MLWSVLEAWSPLGGGAVFLTKVFTCVLIYSKVDLDEVKQLIALFKGLLV